MHKRPFIVAGAALAALSVAGCLGLCVGALGATSTARRLSRAQGRACHSLTCVHFHQEGVPKAELGPFTPSVHQRIDREVIDREPFAGYPSKGELERLRLLEHAMRQAIAYKDGAWIKVHAHLADLDAFRSQSAASTTSAGLH